MKKTAFLSAHDMIDEGYMEFGMQAMVSLAYISSSSFLIACTKLDGNPHGAATKGLQKSTEACFTNIIIISHIQGPLVSKPTEGFNILRYTCSA